MGQAYCRTVLVRDELVDTAIPTHAEADSRPDVGPPG
jgi:hypothetical protein